MHPVLARHAPATQLMARSQRTQLAPPKPHESESTPATHCPALSQQPAQLVAVQRSIVRTAPQLETRNRASNIMKRRDMEPRCRTVEGLSPTEVWMLRTCGRRCTTADGPHPRRSHRDGASARPCLRRQLGRLHRPGVTGRPRSPPSSNRAHAPLAHPRATVAREPGTASSPIRAPPQAPEETRTGPLAAEPLRRFGFQRRTAPPVHSCTRSQHRQPQKQRYLHEAS